MNIVDAHLDLAYNAVRGRPVHRPAREQPPDEEGIPTVGLPDLRAGGVDLICATIFCEPSVGGKLGYRNTDEARDQALKQLMWYRARTDDGAITFVHSRDTGFQPVQGARHGLNNRVTGAQRAILLLEGADALRSSEDVSEWHAAGLRIVGVAWKATRYAGGTGQPGPLTPAGVELVRELDRFNIIHDASHLAEESFWQLLDISTGPVIATHSNCRAIVPTDRQLSDDMIRAIAQRGGVIGINFFDKFLIPPAEYGKRRATLADVATHLKHMCDVIGDTGHVGLGTDMDGGLGREQIPTEIETSADLPRVAEAMAKAGFSDADVSGIMGENWLRYFNDRLPE